MPRVCSCCISSTGRQGKLEHSADRDCPEWIQFGEDILPQSSDGRSLQADSGRLGLPFRKSTKKGGSQDKDAEIPTKSTNSVLVLSISGLDGFAYCHGEFAIQPELRNAQSITMLSLTCLSRRISSSTLPRCRSPATTPPTLSYPTSTYSSPASSRWSSS